MMAAAEPFFRRIQSFARRDSRMTAAQQRAFERLWLLWGLKTETILKTASIFGRQAPCFLEIGFGSGQSLAAIAQQYPAYDFIGIEMFKPGIGALLQQIDLMQLKNVRIYYADAVDVLEKCIPEQSLQGIQIFFPDPWPKTRHHKRRLIQPAFAHLAALKLKQDGIFHLATDWQDYARQMMKVLSAETSLCNMAGSATFGQRSDLRPLVTKFEGRGQKEGRAIWELQFARV